MALLAAALAVVVGLIASAGAHPGWAAVAAALGVAAVALVPLARRPGPHVRMRRFADRLETVAVLVTVPLAAGVFGVHELLWASR